ncbi:hypothetical protein JYT12_01045, partial [Beggiatoa alba]|nr:hypothetical protein [Beggiatoa alba]
EAYLDAIEEYGDEFDARMGAEAIHDLIKKIDLAAAIEQIREDMGNTNSETKLKKLTKRLKLLEAFILSDNKPEWMILKVFYVPLVCPTIPN